jgi:hypothetical protein
MIGNDFCIVAGFWNGISMCTPRSFCKNTLNPGSSWFEIDPLTSSLGVDYDLSKGFSHASVVPVGNKLYICGGVRCDLAFLV